MTARERIGQMATNALRVTHETLSPGAKLRREAEEARQKIQRERRESDLRWLMSNAAGRRIVARLMAEARLQHEVSTPEQIGARNHMVRFSGELIGNDLRAWLTMLEESHRDASHASGAC